MSELNLFQRMSKITTEIKSISKNLDVSTGNNSYKAVSEFDVMKEVRAAEARNGVFSYPLERSIESTQILVSSNNRSSLHMRIKTVYRFVNVDKPEEYIDMTTYGDGVDTQDKAPGKAMTYADKYAVLKAYKIPTGDDPDQEGSEDLVGTTPVQMATDEQIKFLRDKYKGFEDKLAALLEKNHIETLKDMPYEFAETTINSIKAKAKQDTPKSLSEV